MLIFLNEYIHPDALARLKEKAQVTHNWDRMEEIDGIILRITQVNRNILDRAKSLKVIGKHGVGCNTIDLEYAKEKGIPVINTPTANTNSVAELIVALMLEVCRKVSYCDAKSRHEGFRQIAPPETTGIELTNKTIGLVGMGNIARRAGEILASGFSARLIGYDPYCDSAQANAYGIEKFQDLNELLEQADLINISVPLTETTKNMISAKNLAHCKKSAILINAARGGIVNEDDLYDALKNKVIRGAACDAFVQEPPTKANKLMELDNFCATPHIGANTEEALYRMGMEIVDEVIHVIEGGKPKHRVV